MPNVSRESIKRAVSGMLGGGQKVSYSKVQRALSAAGVSTRYKGTVKGYQAKAAFQKLKEAGVLSAEAARAGASAFMREVKKAEAPAGPTKEQIAARGKMAIRERLAEEAKKKEQITQALTRGGKGEEKGTTPRSTALRGASAPGGRAAGPVRAVEVPRAERPESARPAAPEPAEAGPEIPSVREAKDLPLD